MAIGKIRNIGGGNVKKQFYLIEDGKISDDFQTLTVTKKGKIDAGYGQLTEGTGLSIYGLIAVEYYNSAFIVVSFTRKIDVTKYNYLEFKMNQTQTGNYGVLTVGLSDDETSNSFNVSKVLNDIPKSMTNYAIDISKVSGEKNLKFVYTRYGYGGTLTVPTIRFTK